MEVVYIDSFTDFPAATSNALAWTLIDPVEVEQWQGSGTQADPLLLTFDTSSGMNTAIGNEGPHNISGFRGAPLGTVNSVAFTGAITELREAGHGSGQQSFVTDAAWNEEGDPTDSYWFQARITGGTPNSHNYYTVTATCAELSDSTSTWIIADASSAPASPGGTITYAGWTISSGTGSTSVGAKFSPNTNYKVGSFTSPANPGGTNYQADMKMPDIVHVHPDNTDTCTRASVFRIILTVTDSASATADLYVRVNLLHSDG